MKFRRRQQGIALITAMLVMALATIAAAAVLGGCSLRGGEGSVLGIALGAVLLQVLQNLVNLLGIPSSLNFAVMGGVILAGVVMDGQLQRFRTRRVGRGGGPAPAVTPKVQLGHEG